MGDAQYLSRSAERAQLLAVAAGIVLRRRRGPREQRAEMRGRHDPERLGGHRLAVMRVNHAGSGR